MIVFSFVFVFANVDNFVCQALLSAVVYVRKCQVRPIRPIRGGTYSPHFPCSNKKTNTKTKIKTETNTKTKTETEIETKTKTLDGS